MSTPDRTPAVIETQRNMVCDLMMALLDSIPPGQINPKKYWDWALKALKVGAKRARNPREFVTQAAGQLKLSGPTRKKCDSSISSVVADIEARGWWPEVRRLILAEHTMIIVEVRVRREQRRGASNPHAVREEDFLPYPE